MNSEIWFFYTPDGEHEITVIGKKSAQNLVSLMSKEQKYFWKCRKNHTQNNCFVHECSELHNSLHLLTQHPKASTSSSATSITSLHETTPIEKHQTKNRHSEILQKSSEISNEELGILIETQNPDSAQTIAAPPPYPAHENHKNAPKILKEKTNPGWKKKNTNTAIVAEVSPQTPINQRRHERYCLRLRVVLISGNRSFRTYSKDISKGGMSFEHVVPKELIDQNCRVVIGSSDMKENLEFEAHIVGDPKNPRAVAFHDPKEIFIKKLENWLSQSKKAA
jgi:hypothetical protein